MRETQNKDYIHTIILLSVRTLPLVVKTLVNNEDAHLVEFMHLVFTCMPGQYQRPLRSP